MSQSLYKVVFVLGPPGCGKGTQCGEIAQHFGFVHLSAGDLLRAERDRSGSEYGALIENHIKNGSIVPVEITCALLEKAMKERSHDAAGFLVDGFPRNANNLEGWQKEMSAKICVKRCLNRGQGRSDDNEESLRKRIQTYNTETLPIIQHYEKLGLTRSVDASKSREEVFDELRKYFEAVSSPVGR